MKLEFQPPRGNTRGLALAPDSMSDVEEEFRESSLPSTPDVDSGEDVTSLSDKEGHARAGLGRPTNNPHCE